MKKIIFAFCALMIFSPVLNSQLSAANRARKYVLSSLKKYSLTGYYILHQYDNSPDEIQIGSSRMRMSKTDFMMYARGRSELELLSSINTIVHETCHGYTHRMAYSLLAKQKRLSGFRRYMAVYVGGDKTIVVKITKTFPSREMVDSFKASQITPRFSTYINSSQSNLGTQVQGVFGLLDELNAYYHGTKAAYDMLPLYKKMKRQTYRTWQNYLQGVNGTYYAYLEFKFFIIKYLLYAKKNRPEIYKEILANTNFKKAFIRVDKNFAALIRVYFANKKDIFSYINQHGVEIKETERGLMFKTSRGYMGTGNFMGTYKKLENELSKDEYKKILKVLNSR